MLIVESPSLCAHIGAALRDRIRQLRRNGMAVPAELVELADALLRPGAVRSGQERSKVAGGARAGEDDPAGSLVSASEAARWLGISERSLRRRVAAGEIEPVRIGRRVSYDPAVLAEYVRRGGKRGPAVDAAGAG